MYIKQTSVLTQVAMEATEVVMDQVVLVNIQEPEELVQNLLKRVFAVY